MFEERHHVFPALGESHFDYVGEKLEEFFGLNF